MAATARSYRKGTDNYRPTQEDRETVRSMIMMGIEQNAICTRLGITNKTLHKHFRRDLDTAYTTMVYTRRVQISNKADAGDTQALIYLNRVHGWNDRPNQAVNVNLGLSLANMDEAALRAELAEILTIPEATGRTPRRRVTIDAEATD